MYTFILVSPEQNSGIWDIPVTEGGKDSVSAQLTNLGLVLKYNQESFTANMINGIEGQRILIGYHLSGGPYQEWLSQFSQKFIGVVFIDSSENLIAGKGATWDQEIPYAAIIENVAVIENLAIAEVEKCSWRCCAPKKPEKPQINLHFEAASLIAAVEEVINSRTKAAISSRLGSSPRSPMDHLSRRGPGPSSSTRTQTEEDTPSFKAVLNQYPLSVGPGLSSPLRASLSLEEGKNETAKKEISFTPSPTPSP